MEAGQNGLNGQVFVTLTVEIPEIELVIVQPHCLEVRTVLEMQLKRVLFHVMVEIAVQVRYIDFDRPKTAKYFNRRSYVPICNVLCEKFLWTLQL